ncbi:MAG: Rrf2 family transcriptional regulator [Cyanobacteria bacterium P01_F01_bin.150]
MQLSLHSDFALRLLMQLAVNPDRLCTIAEVADTYQISKNHLVKVAHLLVREGFVESVRGRSGGLRLSKSPSMVTIAEVLRVTENDLAVLDCLQDCPAKSCPIDACCRLKAALAEATEAFLEVLEGYTIEDTVTENRTLKSLLALSTGSAS